MIFKGISREFSLCNEDQYNAIGAFWDEFTAIYGLENLRGLGYKWTEKTIFYAIGLKDGEISGYNLCIELADENFSTAIGETKKLKKIYDEIYKDGPLKYEIEEFYKNGKCQIKYFR